MAGGEQTVLTDQDDPITVSDNIKQLHTVKTIPQTG